MSVQEITELFEIISLFGPNTVSVVFMVTVLIVGFKYRKIFKNLNSFIRDWHGTPKEPGRSRVPGVMERLNDIDGQLKNNGGSSVKDAVDRIEIRVNEIDERLADGDKKFDELFKQINKIQKDIY
jgi:hypothetical protein